MNAKELRLGHTGTLSSWHRQYKDSAWIFVGGLHYELTEGDVICVFSQYGEIVNINLVRDRKTGVSKGFAFLCYEDQRSTVLATDNLNGIKLAGRIIRVDHVEKYKVPKEGGLDVGLKDKSRKRPLEDEDLVTAFVREHGCGPQVMKEINKLHEKQKLVEEKLNEKRNVDHRRHEHSRTSNPSREDREPHSCVIKEESRDQRTNSSHCLRNPSPLPPAVSVKKEAISPLTKSHHERSRDFVIPNGRSDRNRRHRD